MINNLADIFLIYVIFISFKFLFIHLQYFLNENTNYLLFILKLFTIQINCLMFALSQYVIAHCYATMLFTFIFVTKVFFIKLDQVNGLLNSIQTNRLISNGVLINKTNKNDNCTVDNQNQQLISYFMYFHVKVLADINKTVPVISRLYSAYFAGNIPMGLLLFANNLQAANTDRGLFIFSSFIIFQQFIGCFIVHMICTSYTSRIHRCSQQLIYCFFHYPLKPLSLQIKISNYIQKIHTTKRYGIRLFGCYLINIDFFIKVH